VSSVSAVLRFVELITMMLIIGLCVQQIAEMQKENFSLKLRIYFLEERMKKEWDGSGDDVHKIVRNVHELLAVIHSHIFF